MKTELKDVLHLYLGQLANIVFKSGNEITLSHISPGDLMRIYNDGYDKYPLKPILLPISDMAEEEMSIVYNLVIGNPFISKPYKITHETRGNINNGKFHYHDIKCLKN